MTWLSVSLKKTLKTCALTAFVLTAAAACGQVPKPFQPDVKSFDNPLLVLGDGAGVVVLPFAGLQTIDDGAVFAEAMADELRRENVPASTRESTNLGTLFLSGRVEFLPPGLRGEGQPQVNVHWELLSQEGGVLADLQDEVLYDPTSWAQRGNTAIAKETARRAAPRIATILQTQVAYSPEAPGPTENDARVRVLSVEGAPGDGNRSLTIAMKAALRRANVTMVQDVADATLVLAGGVSTSPVAKGNEEIKIDWKVLDVAEREVGNIAQANVIKAGSLSGAWGDVARLVADGAVDGLLELIERTEAQRAADAENTNSPTE